MYDIIMRKGCIMAYIKYLFYISNSIHIPPTHFQRQENSVIFYYRCLQILIQITQLLISFDCHLRNKITEILTLITLKAFTTPMDSV
jgi:hypothetical protein